MPPPRALGNIREELAQYRPGVPPMETLWGVRWAPSQAFLAEKEGFVLLRVVRLSCPEAYAVRCKAWDYVQIRVLDENGETRDRIFEEWRSFRRDMEAFYAEHPGV